MCGRAHVVWVLCVWPCGRDSGTRGPSGAGALPPPCARVYEGDPCASSTLCICLWRASRLRLGRDCEMFLSYVLLCDSLVSCVRARPDRGRVGVAPVGRGRRELPSYRPPLLEVAIGIVISDRDSDSDGHSYNDCDSDSDSYFAGVALRREVVRPGCRVRQLERGVPGMRPSRARSV